MKHSAFCAVACALLANIGSALGSGSNSAGQAADGDTATLIKRDSRCGPGYGSCDPGECCSEEGFCGTDSESCAGSSCQLDYCDSCDTFFGPPGSSTENIPRPKIGSVPYGSIITKCTKTGMIALTFDDGPYLYTTQMLDVLDELEVTATFFIAGNNRGKGRIDDPANGWIPMLERMRSTGHQIASHTWTHRDLSEVNSTIRQTELIYNEMAFRNIFGWFPAYMRPPYLECSSACLQAMSRLGYHVINVNVDTKDFEFNDPSLIQRAKDRFSDGVSRNAAANSYIVLAHDVQYQTVVNLTAYMVQESRSRGYRLVTVGECLGDPQENWYRDAPRDALQTTSSCTTTVSNTATVSNGATTDTSSRAQPTQSNGVTISPDQSCGGGTGYTCVGSSFGECCSHYGFCGASDSYCGTGCDPNFGFCNPKSGGISDTTNGLCGSAFSATCANFGDKVCCSQFGFCGNSRLHCGTGCQDNYGECD